MDDIRYVYICSPYRNNIVRNRAKAIEYCRAAIDRGYIPIAPHLYFPLFLDDKNDKERNIGISVGKEFMNKCCELWVFGEEITSGMKEEIEYANSVVKQNNPDFRIQLLSG